MRLWTVDEPFCAVSPPGAHPNPGWRNKQGDAGRRLRLEWHAALALPRFGLLGEHRLPGFVRGVIVVDGLDRGRGRMGGVELFQ
jgi:hypothetical protein